MEQVTYGFVLRAGSPIAHHSETLGNVSVLMTRGQRMADGSIIQIPCITADTMRHGVREAAMDAFIKAAGLKDLSTPALRLLFSGGQITGSAGGSVSIKDYHEMVDLLPPLALLGGCCNNRMVPGRMTVEDAVLLSEETLPMMPDWVQAWLSDIGSSAAPVGLHVEEATRVRMDPVNNPTRRALLGSKDRDAEEKRLALSEKAGLDGDAVEQERTKSTMMPRTFERLVAGSLFFWQIHALVDGDLERDLFHVMLLGFLADARVGGKRGTGHGHLVPEVARSIKLTTTAEVTGLDVTALAKGSIGDIFRTHVGERRDKIASFLSEVEA